MNIINTITAIFVFFFGWVVMVIGTQIFGFQGETQNLGAVIVSILYLSAIVTYFSLQIIELLNKNNKVN